MKRNFFTARVTECWDRLAREVGDIQNLLWGYSKPPWSQSCATCSRWPGSSWGLGLNDLQRSLPTSITLWLMCIILINCTQTRAKGQEAKYIRYHYSTHSKYAPWTLAHPRRNLQLCPNKFQWIHGQTGNTTTQTPVKATSSLLYLCIFSSYRKTKRSLFIHSASQTEPEPSIPLASLGSCQDFPMASKADEKPFYFPDHAVTPVNQGSAPTNPHHLPQTLAFILWRKKTHHLLQKYNPREDSVPCHRE